MVNPLAMAKKEGISSFRRAAMRIATWTLASRVLGLIRDRLMFGAFGRGPESSAFWLAWTVPNLFRRLLGEGALSAVFVPVLTERLDREGRESARRSLAAVFGALLALLLILVGAGFLVIGLLPDSWLERGEGEVGAPLLRHLLWLLLPYMLPVCLLSLAAGALNVSGSFSLPSAAPFVLNLFWIGGILGITSLDAALQDRIRILALFLLLGGCFQLGIQLPGLRKHGLLVRPRWEPGSPDLLRLGKGLLPMLLGLSVIQINVLATQIIAFYLTPEVGGNSVIFLANRLLEFPHALLGIALGTAVFPLLSRLSGRGDEEALGRTVDRSLSLGLFLALPAMGGLITLAPQLVEVFFVHGRFSVGDGVETAGVLRILALSLPGLVAIQILARTHYAMGDLKRPVRLALVSFLVALALNLHLAPRLGTEGLAIGSTLCALLNALLLLLSFLARRPGRPLGGVLPALGRSALATLPTCLLAYGMASWMEAWMGGGGAFLARVLLILLVPVTLASLLFFLMAKLLRAREIRELGEALGKGGS